jgi:hypothetical protein
MADESGGMTPKWWNRTAQFDGLFDFQNPVARLLRFQAWRGPRGLPVPFQAGELHAIPSAHRRGDPAGQSEFAGSVRHRFHRDLRNRPPTSRAIAAGLSRDRTRQTRAPVQPRWQRGSVLRSPHCRGPGCL